MVLNLALTAAFGIAFGSAYAGGLGAGGAEIPEPNYHRADEVLAEMALVVDNHPTVATQFSIGTSVEGRKIYAWRMSDPAVPVVGKMLVFGNIHAMEWVPTEVALAFAQDFAISPILGVELVVVPSLNVDGRHRVETDLNGGENTYRRGNANSVDLNRDFSVNRESTAIWRVIIPRRYAVSPAALSQPESRAIDTLAANEQFDAAVSLHGFGGFFYYPWAGLWARTPDHNELHRLGVVMRDSMEKHRYKPMQLARWGFYFRGLGMEVDHLYGRYGAMSFLIETTRSGIESLDDLKTYFRWYNPRDPARHVAEGVRYLRALAGEVGAGRARKVVPPFPADDSPRDQPTGAGPRPVDRY